MKTTLHNLLTTISIISALLLICLLVLFIFGFRPYILESSSMEPTITKGSLVFARNVPLDKVKDGSVIIYHANSLLVLHRYIGDGQLQGDANSISQEVELNETNFVGTYAFHIPGVGSIISFLLRKYWILLSLAGVAVILACTKFEMESAT